MGYHQSRQLGGAGEFVDFREYTGGEDLRRLDWKVLARTGKAFVRLHEEETNLDLHARRRRQRVDALRRGRPARRPRLEARIRAIPGHRAVARDQPAARTTWGLAVLDGGAARVARPGRHRLARRTPPATHRERRNARQPDGWPPGCATCSSARAAAACCCVMSDFLMEDLEDVFAALRLFRHRGWDIVVLHLVHPDEERLPEGVAYRFEGLEDDGRVNCSPAEIRAAYRERFAAHLAMVRQLALAGGCDYRRVVDGHSLLADVGRIPGRASGIRRKLAVEARTDQSTWVKIMTFLHPWAIVIGVAAAAGPVLIHWLTRPRPVRMPLSTLRFVREAVRQRRSWHRLRDLAAACAADARRAAVGLGRRSAAVGAAALSSPTSAGATPCAWCVLDVSQSMAARTGAVEQIERARTVAARYLRYRPGLAANLILAGARPQSGVRRSVDQLRRLARRVGPLPRLARADGRRIGRWTWPRGCWRPPRRTIIAGGSWSW